MFGTVAAGRIGFAVLRRLKPFDMHLHYNDRTRLPESVEKSSASLGTLSAGTCIAIATW